MGRRQVAESLDSLDSLEDVSSSKSKALVKIPTVEEMQEKLADFQQIWMKSFPSKKEVKSQRKKVKKSYNRFMKALNEAEWLDDIEEKSNVPRLWLFWMFVGFLGLITVLSFFVKFMGIFMTRFLGFVYPVYASIKALITERKDDDTQWLMYWVVYAAFSLFEQVALEQSKVLPLFFSLKLVFLFWCQFASGAEFLYKLLIKPVAIAIRAISG